MSDTINAAECTNAANTDCSNSQAVCIDALRVYDSCGDKDCLSDLPVYFTDAQQEIINAAVNVRIKEAEVVSVLTDLEAVPFHKGFYSVDMTYFFNIILDVFTAPGESPTVVNGLSVFNKKVILYGSEGGVKVFKNTVSSDDIDIQFGSSNNLPKVSVQVAKPIALSAKLKNQCCSTQLSCRVPVKLCRLFGGEFRPCEGKIVTVSLGVFSIVQMERNVQMLVPSYDYCIPEKECRNSSDNPCEVFSKLDFPTDEFFPPNVTDSSSECCGCCKY